MDRILVEHGPQLRSRAIITVRGERIRISK
jgi:hypothetical protein